MSFLDKVNKTMNQVTQKTSEAAGVAKVKLDITLKNNEVTDQYKALGEEVYDYYASGNSIDERFSSVCQKITDLKEEIKALEASITSNEDTVSEK